MRKRFVYFGIVLVSLLISSCMTIASQTLSKKDLCTESPTVPNIYSGAIMSSQCAFHYGCEPNGECGFYSKPNNVEFLCLIDVPLSFVLDTVILPFTIYKQNTDGNLCDKYVSKSEDEQRNIITPNKVRTKQ